MKKTKELLKQFEELEMKKNMLADEHHFSEDKTMHLHVLEQIVSSQLHIFDALRKRINKFKGNPQFKHDGIELFNIIEHHLYLENERIHAKDLKGLYDIVERFNREWNDCMIVDYLLNLGDDSHFDKALSGLENNRLYSFLKPRILGLAVSLSLVGMSFGSRNPVEKNIFEGEEKLRELAKPFGGLGDLVLRIYYYNVHLENSSRVDDKSDYESHKIFCLRIKSALEQIDLEYSDKIKELPKELVDVVARGRKYLNMFLNAEKYR